MLSRRSIRVRLTAAFAAGMLLLLVLAGLFTYLKVRSDLDEALDESLQSRADDVAALVASGPGAPELQGERFVDDEDSFAQVLTGEGEVISSTLPPSVGPAITRAEAERAASEALFLGEREIPGIDGDARLLARPARSTDATQLVVIGATTQDRTEALGGLTGAFVLGGPVAVLLASGLGYLLAGRALAPVGAMRRRASEITLDRSGERLPLPPADDELRALAGPATIPGPLLDATVGDTLVVHFRNAVPIPVTMHPHGVFYSNEMDGAYKG